MKIAEVKDGVMNYVRQISQEDRRARETSLESTFDFDGWLLVLENSVGASIRLDSNDEAHCSNTEPARVPTNLKYQPVQNHQHDSLDTGSDTVDWSVAVESQTVGIE